MFPISEIVTRLSEKWSNPPRSRTSSQSGKRAKVVAEAKQSAESEDDSDMEIDPPVAASLKRTARTPAKSPGGKSTANPKTGKAVAGGKATKAPSRSEADNVPVNPRTDRAPSPQASCSGVSQSVQAPSVVRPVPQRVPKVLDPRVPPLEPEIAAHLTPSMQEYIQERRPPPDLPRTEQLRMFKSIERYALAVKEHKDRVRGLMRAQKALLTIPVGSPYYEASDHLPEPSPKVKKAKFVGGKSKNRRSGDTESSRPPACKKKRSSAVSGFDITLTGKLRFLSLFF